jgi:hypothetical protein
MKLKNTLGISLALALGVGACDLAYPEVVVINRTYEHVMLKNLSFNGCVWNTVLAYDETTSPGHCLPGSDRVHFLKLDAESYCLEQAEDGTIDGLCLSDAHDGGADGGIDPGLVNEEPTWFNYQTISAKSVDYGDFRIFEIVLDDMEQDFSASGPGGH